MSRFDIALGKEPPKEDKTSYMGMDLGQGGSQTAFTAQGNVDGTSVIHYSELINETVADIVTLPHIMRIPKIPGMDVGSTLGIDTEGRPRLFQTGDTPFGIVVDLSDACHAIILTNSNTQDIRSMRSAVESLPQRGNSTLESALSELNRDLGDDLYGRLSPRSAASRPLVDEAEALALLWNTPPSETEALSALWGSTPPSLSVIGDLFTNGPQSTEASEEPDFEYLMRLQSAMRNGGVRDASGAIYPALRDSEGEQATEVPESHLGELHEHPVMQRRLNIPDDHVIVDKDAWERARERLGMRNE